MALITVAPKTVNKISTEPGMIPTLGPSFDYTDGTWTIYDIYEGEIFMNTADKKVYTILDGTVIELTGGDSLFMPGSGADAIITVAGSNIATGNKAFAIGTNNKAIGDVSFATGDNNENFGTASFTYGTNSKTNSYGERSASIGTFPGGLNTQEGTMLMYGQTSGATLLSYLETGDGLVDIPLQMDTAYVVDLEVQATIYSATNKGNTKAFKESYIVKNITGSTAITVQTGSTFSFGQTGTTTLDCELYASGTGVFGVLVQNSGVGDINWFAKIKYTRIQFA